MRSMFRRALVALVAVFALSAIAASAASASPEWYVKKAGTWSKVGATAVQIEANESNFEIINTKYEGFPSFFAVSCKSGSAQHSLQGELKASGKSMIDSFGGGECKPSEGSNACRSFRKIEAVAIPWEAELFTEGSELRQRVLAGGQSRGVDLTCEGLKTEFCSATTSTHTTNVTSPGLEVWAEWNAKSAKVQCTNSLIENAGEWKGVLKIKPTKAEKEKGIEGIKVE